MSTETNRVLIPMTNQHFAAWCLKMLGQPYWYASCLYKCSESLRARKAAQYPAHYGSSRTVRYRQDIAAKRVAADCIGAAKGYSWTNGGQGVLESIGTGKTFANHYGANSCPDKSANGMFAYAKSKGMDWGKIGTLPETVGLALHKNGHVGYYVGNGYAVEWRGFAYGCVKTKVAGRGWQYWYKLPFLRYDEVSGVPAEPVEPAEPETAARDLFYVAGATMLRGEDVRALQVDLNRLGYACGEVDGIFGPKTNTAVRAFQRDHGLEVDGVVGEKTRAALEEALGHAGTDVEAQEASDEHGEGAPADGEAPDSDEGDAEDEDDADYVAPGNTEILDFGTRLLRYRKGHAYMTGDDVAAVQKQLIQLGFAPGKADGIYGLATAAAVKVFQAARKIEADGVVGPDTRAALTR